MKVITFGCRLNHFESELIKTFPYPNATIINTCAVTSEAERQCRQVIRKEHLEYPEVPIIVTGCAAQLNPSLYAQLPGVIKVLGNADKLKTPFIYNSEKVQVTPLDCPVPIPDFLYRTNKTRGLVQIQQGCDNLCTFCVTRLVRGKSIGLPPEKILAQVNNLISLGIQEITLTGVNLGAYPFGLSMLVKKLLEIKGIKRLRLGSLDPALIDQEFLENLNHPTLMPHFHFSLQAGDDHILKLMGRRHTCSDAEFLFEKMKMKREDITFGADFIAGFPTETEENFNNTLNFIERNNITHLHVFPYSVRPGTPASKLKMLDLKIRKSRAKKMRE